MSTTERYQREQPLVLIVDDDVIIRMLARESLEQHGFAVDEAEDGIAALSAFERLKPDIVLMDVMMPNMDGFAACARLRTLPGGCHTPVVIMTAFEDMEAINHAYESGATDLVTKPINWTILRH